MRVLLANVVNGALKHHKDLKLWAKLCYRIYEAMIALGIQARFRATILAAQLCGRNMFPIVV